ncbi:MAG: hypothetical protein IKO01_07085 [Kiritimatiellae bacterium]|nr:hypothetical protein [Kiritimatiellia bacterium]
MKWFKILSAALLALCIALATASAEWVRVHVPQAGRGGEISEVGKVAAIVGTEEDVWVQYIRRHWTTVEQVTTNATVETEYRVRWKTGNTTNTEYFASASNAAVRVAAIQANTNLTLLGGGYTTNYTTNVYAIVTNWVPAVASAETNTLDIGAFVLPGDILLEKSDVCDADVILEK